MKKPLSIYTYCPREHSASSHYRILVPLLTASEIGLPVRPIIDTDKAGIEIEDRIKAFCEADVIMLYQPTGEANVQNVRGAKSILPTKQEDGWKYPPTFIVDTDDNLFNVNPHNSAYKVLGFRDHEGRDVPPGHTIGCVQAGEKKVLWRDKDNGFDITRNRHTIDTYRSLLEMADCVTTSRPTVAEAVEADCKPQRVKVWPNLVRMDHYPQISIAPDDQIKILWQGGGAHYEDWYALREQLGRITKKYPQVHWIIWGVLYHWVIELMPPDRYTYVNWCPYNEYKLRRVMFGEDISLCPLMDNRFNRCRSAIKFYEASVLKHPAATLAESTGPYQDEILHRETGLLWNGPDDFETKLSELIEGAALRKRLGANAKDWVNEKRDAFKHVPAWFSWLEELRTKIERDQPRMPDSIWDDFEARMKAEQEAAPSENGAVTEAVPA